MGTTPFLLLLARLLIAHAALLLLAEIGWAVLRPRAP